MAENEHRTTILPDGRTTILPDGSPPCPECDKMIAICDKSHAIGEFIDWLRDEKKIHLAHWVEVNEDFSDPEQLEYIQEPIDKLLAEFFKIDLNKVEAERRVLLEWIRNGSKLKGG